MIQTTSKWKDWSAEFGTFHIKATIDNGTTLNLTDEDFMSGSVSITDSVSGMGSFNVGNVITNSFNATLNNFTGKFNSYNLAGATISVQFGIVFEDSTEEWIDRGTYTLEKPTSLGSTIKVVGYDDMDKMNKYYIGKHPVGGVESDIIFPINAETLAMYLCDECGVDYAVDMWGLDTFQVDEFEYNESTTCRQVLSWVVQIAGGYARVNNIGKLECKTFNRHFWTVGLSLNGGTINPWESIDTYNGGSFSPWSAVTNYDGGGVGGAEFTLSKIKTLNVYVDDITVTGVRAFAYNTVNEFQFDTVGNDGYILAVQDNPLVTEDNTLAVATRVNGQIGGMSFRPFDATIFGDPSFEAGDVIALMDYLGNEHISVITSLTYALNQTERIECNAETPRENENATPNPTISIIQGATYAAYDYIQAKKISADYISAGTITGAVEATNFTMSGGSINIATTSETQDKIELTYNDRSIKISPAYIKKFYQGNQCYYLGSSSQELSAGYLELFNNGTSRIIINARTGEVLVKNSSGTSRVEIDGANGHLTLSDDTGTAQTRIDSTPTADGGYSYFKNRVVIGNNSPYTGYVLSVNGSAYSSGSWSGSLEELKTDIKKVDFNALDIVKDTDIYEFVYKCDKENGLNNTTYGVIIGDGYKCDEHIMSANKDAVSTQSMVSLLWKAIQEQQAQIESLEKRVAELEKESK